MGPLTRRRPPIDSGGARTVLFPSADDPPNGTANAPSSSVPLVAITGAALAGPLRGVGPPPRQLRSSCRSSECSSALSSLKLLAVEIESCSEAHSVNFVELTYVAALVLATPTDLVLGRMLAMAVVMGLVRRQSLHKLNGQRVDDGRRGSRRKRVVFHALHRLEPAIGTSRAGSPSTPPT